MLSQYWKDRNSIYWPAVQGQIIESAVEDKFDGHPERNSDFRPYVKYQYMVDNQSHVSEQYAFKQISMSRKAVQSLIQENYLPNKPVTVYFNPKDPEQAVLEPGFETKKIVFMTLRYLAFSISLLFLIKIISAK